MQLLLNAKGNETKGKEEKKEQEKTAAIGARKNILFMTAFAAQYEV